ncbi:DUF3592 domain-containing protein [Streptomyces sp. NPDC046915]|uniref:DUF3592 domain-containing protein n=1 Tax=Streptomyces sp. NPDC046915 TaxID=3155257 RepID=UPI003402B9DC
MTAWVLFSLFVWWALWARGRVRRVYWLNEHGVLAEAVCEWVSWTDGEAESFCYFQLDDGRRIRVRSSKRPQAPMFEVGEVAQVLYDPDQPTHAVLVEDRVESAGGYRAAMYVFVAGASIAAIAGVIKALV